MTVHMCQGYAFGYNQLLKQRISSSKEKQLAKFKLYKRNKIQMCSFLRDRSVLRRGRRYQ